MLGLVCDARGIDHYATEGPIIYFALSLLLLMIINLDITHSYSLTNKEIIYLINIELHNQSI